MSIANRVLRGARPVLIAAVVLGLWPGGGAADAPRGGVRACAGCFLVAEKAPTYPKKRYSKRAARKAWLKHKRDAGEKGRRDLRRRPGSREGWVSRLRRAQKKHAERVARAERRKARQARKGAERKRKRTKRALVRAHVVDRPRNPDEDRGAWNARKDEKRKDAKPGKSRGDGDDQRPNWNEERKPDRE